MSDDDDDYVGTPSSAHIKLQQQQQQQQQRVSIAPRILQSPTSQNPMHFLGSNDDQLERAQARAARVAASRRKSAVVKPLSVPSSDADVSKDLFGKEQVMELFQNCIKLASENKINQKNTWELGLIDHLQEIITVESEDDTETNFQKASCTLEAGVKIYSLRVDSVHSEAYKVLGGINRVGREDDKENISETDEMGTEQRGGPTKKEKENKMSPLSTLESSFEVLNVKKFDVAFTVDPLYHQTSAQFDEGGAKGLLLSNLGVYGGCKILFDSSEVPGKSISCDLSSDNSEIIDLSFAKEQIEQMVVGMSVTNDIQPSLRDIVNLFDENNKRPTNVFSSPIIALDQDDTINNIHAEWEANDNPPWNFDQDDNSSTIDDDASFIPPSNNGHQEDLQKNDDYESREFDTDDRFEKIAGFLSLGLGFNSKANTWAGPDHWKYRKVKGHELSVDQMEEPLIEKKTKTKKQVPSEVDFTKSLDREMTDLFIAPKNPRTLLLPLNRVPCNVLLPEDCHYHPENLVKLFLLPDVMCFAKKGRKPCYETRQQDHACDSEREWDDGNNQFDDAFSDTENSGDLVSQPRQVSKIEIEYDKFSKQVDVHALKEVLWDHITKTVDTPSTKNETAVPFKQVLTCFANESVIPSLEDVSPHLFFICLLHLANEHSLRICDRPTLDELDIYVSPAKPKN